jgi:multidrug efflux pump
MLTGTLITVAGFLPVGLAQSQAGEYTEAIFQDVAISLLLSWFGAVIFTPYLGFFLLKAPKSKKDSLHDLFDTPFYNRLRYWIIVSVSHRKKVIVATVLLFWIKDAAGDGTFEIEDTLIFYGEGPNGWKLQANEIGRAHV